MPPNPGVKGAISNLNFRERRRSPYVAVEAEARRSARNTDWIEDRNVIVEANKARFLKALAANLACVADACRMTGVSRTTFYRWMRVDAAFRDHVENVIEADVCDMVEEVLLRRIFEHNDIKAMKFFLSRKGKARGW